MCFISPSTALQRIKIEKKKPKLTETVQKVMKQEKTENYKQLKTTKRILDRFEETGIECPSYIKLASEGKTSEFGEDSFKKLDYNGKRQEPVFKKNNSLGLMINLESFDAQVESPVQKNLLFDEFEPLFNYENLFDGKEISDLLSSLEDKRISIDF